VLDLTLKNVTDLWSTCVGLNNVILKLRATGKFTAKGHLLS
jgi:hypothetical protein